MHVDLVMPDGFVQALIPSLKSSTAGTLAVKTQRTTSLTGVGLFERETGASRLEAQHAIARLNQGPMGMSKLPSACLAL
jgi:hypothetical protein